MIEDYVRCSLKHVRHSLRYVRKAVGKLNLSVCCLIVGTRYSIWHNNVLPFIIVTNFRLPREAVMALSLSEFKERLADALSHMD